MPARLSKNWNGHLPPWDADGDFVTLVTPFQKAFETRRNCAFRGNFPMVT